MSDRSAEELEREAERIRSGITDTAEELRHRISPGQMMDDVTRYFRNSDTSVALDNLQRQIRDNPLAIALIGAGIAWLILGDRRRSESGRGRAPYRGGDDARERYEKAAYAAGTRARPGGAYPSGSAGVTAAGQGGSSSAGVAPGSSYGSSEPVGSGRTGSATPSTPGLSVSSSGLAGSTGSSASAASAASGSSGTSYGSAGGAQSGGASAVSGGSTGGTGGTSVGSTTGGTSGKPSIATGSQGGTGVSSGAETSRTPHVAEGKRGSQS